MICGVIEGVAIFCLALEQRWSRLWMEIW